MMITVRTEQSNGNGKEFGDDIGVDALSGMIAGAIEASQNEQVAWQATHDADQAEEQAERYIVVSDRYANEPCISTLAEFYQAVQDLEWPKPSLDWHPGDDTYWEAGEIVLRPAI